MLLNKYKLKDYKNVVVIYFKVSDNFTVLRTYLGRDKCILLIITVSYLFLI